MAVKIVRNNLQLLAWLFFGLVFAFLFWLQGETNDRIEKESFNRDRAQAAINKRIEDEAEARVKAMCAESNQTREAARLEFQDLVNLMIASGENQERTPQEEAERQEQIKRFVEDFNKTLDFRLPPIDCNKQLESTET